ncbi:unnamed protein product [Anisakis simplex]|uniref:Uncharacterized protein n=1 Tax=Anisakis simplex TaxID=6269 RepID=A0A0M3JLQ9_ANISI|nr:unnamed protein product [Anisakis simplex]
MDGQLMSAETSGDSRSCTPSSSSHQLSSTVYTTERGIEAAAAAVAAAVDESSIRPRARSAQVHKPMLTLAPVINKCNSAAIVVMLPV